MRKFILLLLVLAGVMLCATAGAESFTFENIFAECAVPDDYIILTPGNLDKHPEWISNAGATPEEILADFQARGVLVQAWNQEGDVCLEITAVQDEDAKRYYDLDQQDKSIRAAYRTQHLKGALYKSLGYTYQSAEWKNTDQYGRFLLLKYKKATEGGDVSYGYMRRTIRNGYTITIDYHVTGRKLAGADSKAVDKVLGSWKFYSVTQKTESNVAKVEFTAPPPTETDTGAFTVEGVCSPGMHLIGVVMRMSSPDPIRVEATANKKGEFSMDVALPKEGVWLMTVTVLNGDTVTEELVFDPTTYQKSLLVVNFDEPLPTETIEGDKLVISGKTLRNTTVQCIMGEEYSKKVTTNASGKFKFTIDTSAEGTYPITLVFQKKNYEIRRMNISPTRTFTEEDRRAFIREEAVKPAYTNLTAKMTTRYLNKTVTYNLYITKVEQSGEQWVIHGAMRKLKKGYRDIVIVTTDTEPTVAVGTQHRMYGTCTGPYAIVTEDGAMTYPGIELLFWDD